MVERERQVTQSLREYLCARSIAASRAALKQGYCFLKRQHMGIWRADVVINQEPCCALFCQATQRSLRRYLNISFFWRCRTQRHSKTRKSTQEARAHFGWTPTNTRIETPEAVRILNGQCCLTHAAHALHSRATHRRMRHGSGLIVHQDGVELVQLFSAACKARDTRWHPDERSWRRWCCLRLTRRRLPAQWWPPSHDGSGRSRIAHRDRLAWQRP